MSGDRGSRNLWYCVRRNGVARRSGWIRESPVAGLARRVGAAPGERIEVSIARDFERVPWERFSKVFIPRARGRTGLEITARGYTLRLAPTRMIAANLSFPRAIERFRHEHGLTSAELESHGSLRSFSARQLLLSVGDAGATELFRGQPQGLAEAAGGEEQEAALADGVGRWALANLGSNGQLPYKYWPSRGEESPADNAIRRFLASLALARLGELRSDAAIRDAAFRNLRFNLKRYFRSLGDGRGVIAEKAGAKLGAAALAGLAIIESPGSGNFVTELQMLMRAVRSLADPESGFRTFFFPAERDGQNWNFYSGEALLFWAEARRRGIPGAPSARRCARAFRLCRDRHRRNRNPAFIPWHTQAALSLFRQTGRRTFADFAFEMNDWLLPMQQWEELESDLRGRFYDPLRPHFGPPHAASTGAYVEGLADAAALARMLGDGAREEAYARAITRGFRSLRQLQFRGPEDAFYVRHRKRVLGAVRVEAYDNAVRVDAAAHALAAAVKQLSARPQSDAGRAK